MPPASLRPPRPPLPPGIGSGRGTRRNYLMRVTPFDLKLLDGVAGLAGLPRAEWVRLVLREQAAERLLIDNLYPVRIRKGFRLFRADGEKYALDVLTPLGLTTGKTRAWVQAVAFDPPLDACPSGGGAVLVFPGDSRAVFLVDFDAVRVILKGGHGPPVSPVAGVPPGTGSRRSPIGRECQKRTRGGQSGREDGSAPRAEPPLEVLSPVDRAVPLLRAFLAVPRPSTESDPGGVPAFARANGIGRSTLRDAKERLGVVSTKARGRLRGGWCWRLPGEAACSEAISPDAPGTDGTNGTVAPAHVPPVAATPCNGTVAAEAAVADAATPCESAPGPSLTLPAPPARSSCDDPGHLWAGSWVDWWGGRFCSRCQPPDPRLVRSVSGGRPTA